MAETPSALSVDSAADQILSMLGTDDDAENALPVPQAQLEGAELSAAEEDAPSASLADGPDPDAAGEAEAPIDPPASWKADAKARFKDLPREMQQTIADREREREVHFSRTQSEAAQARRAAEVERQTVQQERQAYVDQLGRLVDLTRAVDPVLAEGDRTDWAKLSQEDPAAAQAKWAAYQGRLKHLGAWMAHRDQITARAQEQDRQHSEEVLAKTLDFWRDDGKRKAFKSAMGQYLSEAGFQPGEVQNVTDARAILLARKAMLYDQLLAQQARIPTARKAPPAARTLRTQVSLDDAINDKALALTKRAAKTGRLDDQAAAVLAALD